MEDSTKSTRIYSMQGTVFQTADFLYVSYSPETASRVTLASLCIGFQPNLPYILQNHKTTKS